MCPQRRVRRRPPRQALRRPRSAPDPPPIRRGPTPLEPGIYRRRRRVVGVAVAIAVTVLTLGAQATSTGSGRGPASAAGAGAVAAERSVRARPGDSLWSIAEDHRGEVGIDRYIDKLVELNGGTIDPGRPARSVAVRRPPVPWGRALPRLPGRRHEGCRFAPRSRGSCGPPASPLSVVRSPIHHL